MTILCPRQIQSPVATVPRCSERLIMISSVQARAHSKGCRRLRAYGARTLSLFRMKGLSQSSPCVPVSLNQHCLAEPAYRTAARAVDCSQPASSTTVVQRCGSVWPGHSPAASREVVPTAMLTRHARTVASPYATRATSLATAAQPVSIRGIASSLRAYHLPLGQVCASSVRTYCGTPVACAKAKARMTRRSAEPPVEASSPEADAEIAVASSQSSSLTQPASSASSTSQGATHKALSSPQRLQAQKHAARIQEMGAAVAGRRHSSVLSHALAANGIC
jgi:hypothetical protein